jgi:Short C-terminal domain
LIEKALNTKNTKCLDIITILTSSIKPNKARRGNADNAIAQKDKENKKEKDHHIKIWTLVMEAKLAKLKEQGVISESEFQQMKQDLLKRT